MTSKAQRKRIQKAVRQRQGRPRKVEAKRYACGKAKAEPVTPNPVVLEGRLAMGGHTFEGQRATDNPLDYLVWRKLITPAEHQAGADLAAHYRRSGYELPDIRTQDLAKISRGSGPTMGDPRSMAKLRAVAEQLEKWPKPRLAVFETAVMGAWPKWWGHADLGQFQLGLNRLRLGLQLVARALARPDAVPVPRKAA